ncbi:MAG: hypothetical protein Q9159_004756 [Coniocarpon cinnabarinum]
MAQPPAAALPRPNPSDSSSSRSSISAELTTAKSEGNLRSQRASCPEPVNALKATRSNCETATSDKIAALNTPCYFHRRFGDTLDIGKVLDEIADESISHSRMVQTATGIREVSKKLQNRPIRRASRTVLIVTKARDNNLVLLTRELARWLMGTPRYGSSQGVTVFVDSKLRKSKRFDADGLIAEDQNFDRLLRYWTPDLCWSVPERFDLVLTLGGDGTVLYTSWLFQRVVPPVLSFSLGSLGFLTPYQYDDYQEVLNRTMGSSNGTSLTSSPAPKAMTPVMPADVVSDAGMRVNFRMRFTCTVFRSPRSPQGKLVQGPAEEFSQFEVLNELVIDRGPSPYVSNLELFGDDSLLTVIQADGVIFSTPTGSTAYSLSAGGSLVHPDIPAILLTPICPHTLSFRPMLLNDTMALRIAVPRNSRGGAYCSFDGKGRIELRQGDFVNITASKYPFPTVMGGQMEWIDSVSRTLRWNTRQAQKAWGDKSFTLGPSARPSMSGSSAIAGRAGSLVPMMEDIAIEDVVDGEEAEEEPVEYDIDISDEDDPIDSRDSGYEGDAASSASGVEGPQAMRTVLGVRQPVRQQTL